MKESYGEGLATHTGPESCGAACKGGTEALTGVRAGRVLSRESDSLRDADAVGESGRPHLVHRHREVLQGPAMSVYQVGPSAFSYSVGVPEGVTWYTDIARCSRVPRCR